MKTLKLLLALTSLLLSGLSTAVETKPFDAATFAELQNAGKPILVDVRADWCPTCKAQAPIIASLLATPTFKDYTVLEVNFDTQPSVLRQFKVTQQSTLIVFSGKSEKGRSTGDTRKEGIAALLRKALS
jgi:thiol-disulfide isomerase/thioredoxin